MIRLVVIAVIAAVAGVMGYLWFDRNCRDGVIIASRALCPGTAGLDAAACDGLFAAAERSAMSAGIVFPLQADCQQQHDVCIQRTSPPQGWSPRPTGLCLVRDSGGRMTRIDPLFDRAGGRRMN